MGCADGVRTRKYHGLLLVASPSDERRYMLVNGVEAWIETSGTLSRRVPLNTHRYQPDALHPVAEGRGDRYSDTPFPTWTFDWPGGLVEHSISGVHGHAATVLRWYWGGKAPAKLRVRLQMSGRDWHAVHRENTAFRVESEPVHQWGRRFAPYPGVTPIVVYTSADYRHDPLWFRNLQYDEERARGLDHLEDLASPGEYVFDLDATRREAVMVLTTDPSWGGVEITGDVRAEAKTLREREKARIDAFPSPIARVADQFIVTRGKRRTIIAGYPWFTDWGRDTFIAVRGLCIANDRRADAEAILMSWCEHLSQGMMPNLFPSGSGEPRYNSVDASLWFIMAVHDLSAGPVPNVPLPFVQAIEEILTHYSRGTRHNIRMDKDGLLAAGEPGLALTWMDAVVDGVPVTPRIGKPVEVQALWINALEFASRWNKRWVPVAAKARASFENRFWNADKKCLYDVVDVDHVAGAVDDRLRPNQIFACGGLPKRVVDDRLAHFIQLAVMPLQAGMALRTLGPDEPGYIGHADGPLRQRDLAYHQGTAWPWLAAAFWDALTRFDDDDSAGMSPVLAPPVLEPLPPPSSSRVDTGGVEPPNDFWWIAREIIDGDPPHLSRGCPFQAWSVGEHMSGMARLGRFKPPDE